MRTAAAVAIALLLSAATVWCVFRNGASEKIQPAAAPPKARRVLRVCSDPNNLPYSNKNHEGFENRIAEIIARDLNADLEYTWWAQRRGYIRNTLRAGQCDVLMGVPTGLDMVLVTAPYYRSSYVFVSRRDRGLHIKSLDSPLLKKLRVGVQLVGDDATNTPPAHALARRGIINNIRGYSVVGDYNRPNPPARIIDAVASGEVDVAVAWGPMAGYFAQREPVPLEIVPVSPQIDLPFLPFVYDISLGVRRGEDGFKAELEACMERHRAEIDAVLRSYGVPRLDISGA